MNLILIIKVLIQSTGPIQEIANSFAYSKMLIKGGKVRVILVIENLAFFGRFDDKLRKVADHIYEIFPQDFNTIVYSCMILITKANLEDSSLEDYFEIIKNILQSNEKTSPHYRMMIRAILSSRHITIFPIPKQITPDIIKDMRNSVSEVKECVLSSNASTILSPNAKIALNEIISNIDEDLRACSKKIIDFIELKFDNQNIRSIEDIQTAIDLLKKSTSIITSKRSKMDQENLENFQLFSEFLGISMDLRKQIKKTGIWKGLSWKIKIILKKFVEDIVEKLRDSQVKLKDKTRMLEKQIDQIKPEREQIQKSYSEEQMKHLSAILEQENISYKENMGKHPSSLNM